MILKCVGFTRIDTPDPDADEQPNVVTLSKGKQERWPPAAEINGEGVFIEFKKKRGGITAPVYVKIKFIEI